MKLIKPDVIIKEQEEGLSGIYKQIEWAGRHCYKSLDKITEDSAKAFVDRMIASGHGAMLEHGTVYLMLVKVTRGNLTEEEYNSKLNKLVETIIKYEKNPYSRIKYDIANEMYCITTNYRVLVENNWLDDLQYICEPTEYHEKRITVKWTLDRVTGESFLRHRVFSFARESTRYCNYSKDKFGNEITFIIPTWAETNEFGEIVADDNECFYHFKQALEFAESYYFTLLNKGWKPQQARQVLPFSVHSPLVMTGFESDWKHFFSLRSPKYGAKGVHPDAAYLADMLYDMFYIEKGYNFSLVHNDAFDGECSYLRDGDMIVYHNLYDKNKSVYILTGVTIKPKDGEEYSLDIEEYTKLVEQNKNKNNSPISSFEAGLLDLSDLILNKNKQQISEEPNDILHITLSDGTDLYAHKDEWKALKEFGQRLDKKEFDNVIKNK